MAVVTNPLMSSEARGKVGGLQLNTWRGRAYVKANTSPAQPRSSLQLKIRAWSTQLVRAWQSLTQSARDSWNQYAADHPAVDWTGNPKRLTGLNWWVRNNIAAWMAGQTGYVSVPTVPAPDTPSDFAAAGGAGQIVTTWTDPAGDPAHLDIFSFGPHSAGLNGKIEKARHKAMANASTETETITGLLAGTYTLFARVIDDNTGLTGVWVSATAVVT
jgi:hypothetical protein